MRVLLVVLLLAGTILPAYAQESTMNKSERYDSVLVPYSAFNVYAKNATLFKLDHEHVTNWDIEMQNKLHYTNQDGNTVVRLYEDVNAPKFIEIGMGGPPDYRFWVAVNTPEDGYFIIHDEKHLGWTPDKLITATHSSSGGLTVSVGEKEAVSNLDIAGFTMREFTVSGMNSASDPPPVDSGAFTFSIISGDPSQNIIFYMPFMVLAVTLALIFVLLKTKNRNSEEAKKIPETKPS
ncbi:hypothetical protein [Candidatus Nitrosotalea okcheonensis]|uniref:Uncharacterized protein n=1 Tax=Candidatus Nitrosotalea okcheonensis TaxID=1903276 RepID=A0A2H1FHA5_9ARCH|nr:hypothetical protein [Candidatus Nitrosotalea okcheonensis]SMH72137.1 conserved exported protein of unknown function [Candidatus Nitrosotalea okcheonensis]